jgi:hypothetical protein
MIKKNIIALAAGLVIAMTPGTWAHAQTLTASTQTKIQITKGASPASLKRKLKEELEIRAVRNLLEASFAIKMTPQIEAKLPELVELLGDSIQISMDPADGEVLSGKATISVPSAKLKEYLTNKGIGAGDIAAKSAKILVSIDEFIGVATTNDGKTATETEIQYLSDKSSFSDTSAKASGSESASSSSASARKNDVASASSDSVAVSGRQSSAVAARQDTAVAGRRDSAAAYQGSDGRAAAASSNQYAGAQSKQMQAAQSSQYAGAASSSSASSDKSQSASAKRATSASAFSTDQKNVQQQNDKVSYSIKTKMPEFNNARQLGAQDRVLASRLSGEFQNNGLRLVAENDLRAEGGRILPIFEITNNGRINQFVDLIQKKNIEADVWATGQANYTIVGTTPSGTQCNGNLAVQGRFLEGNEIFFEDSLQAAAVGNGDQDCRARLGIALATSLAQVLGQRANKELNARSSRGGVYTLFLYSASTLKRADRRLFQDLIEKVDGLKASEPTTKEYYMAINVQYAGRLKDTIDRLLDKLPWEKAEVLSKANKICVGIEGFGACPAEFK